MAIVSRRNVESGQIATNPVGTGPYRFAGRKSGDSNSLVANPDYWDGPPGVPPPAPVTAAPGLLAPAVLGPAMSPSAGIVSRAVVVSSMGASPGFTRLPGP